MYKSVQEWSWDGLTSSGKLDTSCANKAMSLCEEHRDMIVAELSCPHPWQDGHGCGGHAGLCHPLLPPRELWQQCRGALQCALQICRSCAWTMVTATSIQLVPRWAAVTSWILIIFSWLLLSGFFGVSWVSIAAVSTVLDWFMLVRTFKDHLGQHSLSQLGTSFPKCSLILPQQAWIVTCKKPSDLHSDRSEKWMYFKKCWILNTLRLCSYSDGTMSHIHPGITMSLLILSRATSGAKFPWKKLHN